MNEVQLLLSAIGGLISALGILWSKNLKLEKMLFDLTQEVLRGFLGNMQKDESLEIFKKVCEIIEKAKH